MDLKDGCLSRETTNLRSVKVTIQYIAKYNTPNMHESMWMLSLY